MSELLYGRNAVREALRAGRRQLNRLLLAEGVLVQEDSGALGEAVAEAKRQDIAVQNVPRLRLDQMTSGANHQGVALDTSPYPYADFNDLLAALPGQQDPLVLALDHLQDAQNVATLLRTAEAAGVAGVVLPERRAALITPAVSNASAGAIEHLQIATVNNLPRAIEQLQAAGLWVAGLQEEGAQLYSKVDLRGPLVIVVGSEGSGLQRLAAEKCDFLLRLPMFGRIESLNAAVAGSIVLYEAARQRTTEGLVGRG
ncbi:MAG: 23S rRNA (guanosine(2251)-2'-O)-methyltransferase RlmB [Candidatus Chloroheliales bacterium]|nr:MAG: 23S rRNA (guanosine(2251)-2'-O)-methyltransferase RlmB [Chloroflexota bacterium]